MAYLFALSLLHRFSILNPFVSAGTATNKMKLNNADAVLIANFIFVDLMFR